MSDVDERIYRIKAALDLGLQSWRVVPDRAAQIREAVLEVDKIVDDVIAEVGAYVKVYVAALVDANDRLDSEPTLDDLISLVPNQVRKEDMDAVIAVRSLVNQAGAIA